MGNSQEKSNGNDGSPLIAARRELLAWLLALQEETRFKFVN
jgi:hypothetical protein